MPILGVRTTPDIDDDVLQAAELASARRVTARQVPSELARKALEPTRGVRLRNGVRSCPGGPPDPRAHR